MLFAPQTQSNEVLSQEFRITSPSDRSVEYLAGLYFYAQDTTFDSDLTVGAGANRVFPFPPFLCPAPCTAQEGDFVTSAFDQETRKCCRLRQRHMAHQRCMGCNRWVALEP